LLAWHEVICLFSFAIWNGNTCWLQTKCSLWCPLTRTKVCLAR